LTGKIHYKNHLTPMINLLETYTNGFLIR